MKFKDVYRYLEWIYRCDRCGQLYPIWMTTNYCWGKGIKAMGLKKTKTVCKPCFEDFSPNPRYLTYEEYIWMCLRNPSAETLATISEVWYQPSQYTEEERQEELKCNTR